MSEKCTWWEDGPYYLLESGDAQTLPLSDEVWANRATIRAAFIEAWNKRSPFADGLSRLNPNEPSTLSDRGETVGEFLERFGRPDA